MNGQVFTSAYADVYDTLYSDKDYQRECDIIQRAFQTYAAGPVRTILDLGCGTGNHALPLAARGYHVVGIDSSEEMLARARRKTERAGTGDHVRFHHGDIRDIELAYAFDVVLMMFAVLGYQRNNADVLAAMRTARRHLAPGGLFLFDVWYGPSVLTQRPSQRVKVIPTPDGQVIRVASPELDVRRHLCAVEYHVWHIVSDRIVAATRELHIVRYFFPLEIELFLDAAGFSLLRLASFPDDHEPEETTWNVFGVARAQ